MSNMTSRLLRRNRHFLGVVAEPTAVLNQTIQPQRAQLQPLAKTISERYLSSEEDLDEISHETIADAKPPQAQSSSMPFGQANEVKPKASTVTRSDKPVVSDIDASIYSKQIFSHEPQTDIQHENLNSSALDLSTNSIKLSLEPSQANKPIVTDERLAKFSTTNLTTIKAETNDEFEQRAKESTPSATQGKTDMLVDEPYIAKLKQIEALYEANHLDQSKRLTKMEREAIGSNKTRQTPSEKTSRKPLLPGRKVEMSGSPSPAKQMQTRINIGAINVEVMEPETGIMTSRPQAVRQVKRYSRKSYRGQQPTRKHFGLGQL